MGSGDDIVYVEVNEVLRETDAALMIAEDVWIPKSQIDEKESEVLSEGDSGVLALRRWIADEKGLAYFEEKPVAVGSPREGCDHSGRKPGEPCPSCKYQPESEWSSSKGNGKEVAESTAPVLGDDEAVEEPAGVDVCPTPYELALAICCRVAETVPAPATILEPSAGDGPFVRAAREVWPNARIIAVEPRPECEAKLRAAGANEVFVGTLEGFEHTEAGLILGDIDLAVGNWPFSLAEPHTRLLLNAMKEGATVATLLRVGFYESMARVNFWTEFPEESFAPIVPRPGFKLNGKGKRGTDSQAYGLFVWQNGFNGVSRRANHLVWRRALGPRTRPVVVRFSAFVSPEPNTGCWLWTGGVDKDGYGSFTTSRTTHERASHTAWKLFRGDIPEGKIICHSCDFPPCVNPEHLFLGTYQDNENDKVAKGRQALGERNGSAVLTEDQALQILRACEYGTERQKDIAARFGVSLALVNFINTGRVWKHLPRGPRQARQARKTQKAPEAAPVPTPELASTAAAEPVLQRPFVDPNAPVLE